MQTNPPARRFVPRKTGDATPLGQLEKAVMEVVWAAGEAVQVSDVHAAFPGERPAAYNTVKTTMERLSAKGILARVKQGKAYLYQAVVTRDDLERRIVANALDRLVEQFPQAVASFFVQPAPELSEDKLALLQDAIDRRREGRDD
ncbi:MAG: BlaI/MecI/CopY family transcriptional regulator [Actinomycetota bacterium]